jgi:alpha-beta hydrolase superfamily lysophospholipase
MAPMRVQRHFPEGAGWVLDVRRHWSQAALDRTRRPVLLIPGYCMNTTPLGFHPGGPSMIELLAERGFEVWTANLRGQGDSYSVGGPRDAGFSEIVLEDLTLAIEHVRAHSEGRSDRVDLVGCSLGGTYVFAYMALKPQTHGVGSVVGIGAPLRWEEAHPLLRMAFAAPSLVKRVRVSGTRRVAGFALPLVARRAPRLLSIYMNADICDLSRADELVKTVEDPIPRLNGQIAHWMKQRDLVVEGVNVTEALRGVDRPLLCIVANRDGIVPLEAARSSLDVFRSGELLSVGDERTWFAHADLFISRYAQERVFEPLARWLLERTMP